jgi:SynChlorMet cassette radical SAM/SPASM protein ScmF
MEQDNNISDPLVPVTPQLEKLHVYLTDICNSECKHCWVNASPNNRHHLCAEAVNEQINRAMALGLKVVKVTGGEPLLFEGALFSILEHAVKLGLETRLETNATLLNQRAASRLGDLGVAVYVSLDASSPELHDRFRGRNGSFEQAVEAIESLVARKVHVEVISCVTQGMTDSVLETLGLCGSLGVAGLKFNFPSPYGRGKRLERDGVLLKTEQIIEATHFIERSCEALELTIDIDVPRVFRKHPNQLPRCNVLGTLSILPDGRFSLCGIGITHKEITFGHILDSNIEKVWLDNMDLSCMRLTIPRSGKGVCGLCTEYDHCHSHCMAYAISKLNSLNGPFPLCQDAWVRGHFPKEKLLEI